MLHRALARLFLGRHYVLLGSLPLSVTPRASRHYCCFCCCVFLGRCCPRLGPVAHRHPQPFLRPHPHRGRLSWRRPEPSTPPTGRYSKPRAGGCPGHLDPRICSFRNSTFWLSSTPSAGSAAIYRQVRPARWRPRWARSLARSGLLQCSGARGNLVCVPGVSPPVLELLPRPGAVSASTPRRPASGVVAARFCCEGLTAPTAPSELSATL